MVGKYSDSFQNSETAERYEDVVYGEKSHDHFIWAFQKKRVLSIFEDLNRTHDRTVHLDFACGTGRIISAVETMTTKSTGLDISENMLAIAKKKVKKAELVVGDILEDPHIVGFDYDSITAFRFFLNTEPELRKKIMVSLASRLSGYKSRLIFNIQGNSHSLRHLSIAYRSSKGERHNEMSYGEVCRLAEAAGLEIESWYGYGICPPLLHRTMLGPFARFVDRISAKLPFLKRISYDLLFVCKLKE